MARLGICNEEEIDDRQGARVSQKFKANPYSRAPRYYTPTSYK
jgi:hypothetical protein